MATGMIFFKDIPSKELGGLVRGLYKLGLPPSAIEIEATPKFFNLTAMVHVKSTAGKKREDGKYCKNSEYDLQRNRKYYQANKDKWKKYAEKKRKRVEEVKE